MFWICSWRINTHTKLASIKPSYKQDAILRICGRLNKIRPTSCLSLRHTSWFEEPLVIKITLKYIWLGFVAIGSSVFGHFLSLVLFSMSSNRLRESKWEQWKCVRFINTLHALCQKQDKTELTRSVLTLCALYWENPKMKPEHVRSCHTVWCYK